MEYLQYQLVRDFFYQQQYQTLQTYGHFERYSQQP